MLNKRKISFLFAILPLVLAPGSASAQLEPVSIEYIVSLVSDRLGNATLGKTETVLQQTESGYSVFSKTKAQGLAAIIIGSNEQQSCEFEVRDGRAVSSLYAGGRTDSGDYRVNYDWQNRRINFAKGDDLDMPAGYIVDNCNMPFAVALLRDTGLESETMYVVDGRKKRIRGFKLKSTAIENIDTVLGTMETLKVVFEREFKPERTFTFWLSTQNQYLPLKMEEKRRSRTTTMMVHKISS